MAESIDPEITAHVAGLAAGARLASRSLALLSRADKDAALRAMADALDTASADIIAANDKDIARGRANGLAEGLVDRLRLEGRRLNLSDANADVIKRAELFFNEANTPISETHYAARQAKSDLSRLNETLRQRTAKLAANQVLLQSRLVQRKGVEHAIKESSEHYTKLLKESLVLQDSLRQMTRQLLAEQENEREEISHNLQDEIAQTLLGINVRLLCLKHEAHNKSQGLKKEIANTQKLVLNSAKSVRNAARKLKTR